MTRSGYFAIPLLMLAVRVLRADMPFVTLPPFVVTDDRVLPKPEAWRYAEAEGIEVLSNLPDRFTEPYLRDLQLYRRAVERMWPLIERQDDLRVAVIFCDSSDRVREFRPARSKPIVPGGFGSLSEGGQDEAMLIFPLRPADSDPNRAAAVSYRLDTQQHLYCEAVVGKIGEHVPSWLNLGLSRLLRGMVYHDNLAAFPALTTDPTLKVRQSAPMGSLRQALQQGNFYTLPAMFAKRSARPLSERAKSADGERALQLNADFSGPWADECYEFVYLCLFGFHGQFQGPFFRFATLASQGPVDEAAFTQIFGRDSAAMLDLLWQYTDFAQSRGFRIDEGDGPAIPAMTFRDATDGEVGRIRGDFLLETRQVQPAHWSLVAPYLRGSRDPDLLASLGLQEIANRQPDRARKFLEAAVAGKTRRARAYAVLGRLRLAEALGPTGKGSLSPAQVSDIFAPLSAGLRLPPALPEFYRVILRTWYYSQTPPTLSDFQVINRGAYRFPYDSELIYSDAALHQHLGYHSAALRLT